MEKKKKRKKHVKKENRIGNSQGRELMPVVGAQLYNKDPTHKCKNRNQARKNRKERPTTVNKQHTDNSTENQRK